MQNTESEASQTVSWGRAGSGLKLAIWSSFCYFRKSSFSLWPDRKPFVMPLETFWHSEVKTKRTLLVGMQGSEPYHPTNFTLLSWSQASRAVPRLTLTTPGQEDQAPVFRMNKKFHRKHKARAPVTSQKQRQIYIESVRDTLLSLKREQWVSLK